MKKLCLIACACIGTLFISGCSTLDKSTRTNVDTLNGPPITKNLTPYNESLSCVATLLESNKETFSRKLKMAVGEFPDRTGKVNAVEGAKISQGVEYMAITAMSKFSDSIQLVERLNLAAYRFESDLTSRKLIGDNRNYDLSNGKSLNYRPMLSGSISGADFYITGAITEVNYNLYSGGSLLGISGISFGKKTVAMNVAVDMRIINMRNLEIVDSISLEKQFIGERTKNGVYRFAGDELVMFNGGDSRDEPIQRGVRSLVEKGVSALVGKVMRVETDACFQLSSNSQ